jgi:sortase A
MRRALRTLSGVLIVTGLLLVADAVLAVVWQEPVTALYAKVGQNRLDGDLDKLAATPLTGAERAALRSLPAERERIAFLARSLGRQARDGEALGRIRIPRIHASYVMVEGTGSGALRKGPGHYPGTPLPGMPGTVAVAGHRTTYLAPFRDLDQLHAGDQVLVHMPYADVTYRVDRTQVVAPTALWVTRRTGHDQLVLTACTPRFSASKRIVVFARQVGERPVARV